MPTLIPVDAFIIDRKSTQPIYRQLYDLIQKAIKSDEFPAESKLPSSRVLSTELCISRSTVTTAYDQLIAEGYLISQHGSGTTVAAAVNPSGTNSKKMVTLITPKLSPEMLSPLGRSYLNESRTYVSYRQPTLAVSLPSRSSFPHAVWGKLLAKYARKPLDLDAGYDHPSGIHSLKSAIANYLGLARGVVTRAQNVLILNSTQAAIDLVCRILLQPDDTAWVEDPGYKGVKLAMANGGVSIKGVAVDTEGLTIPQHEQIPKVIYTTPSHQYPSGVTMSYSRRKALLDYANRNNCWILEDDYDSEFRYRGKPLPSLQGLDKHQKVIYMGTFSKSVSPSLRVAYLVVPENLRTLLNSFFADTGQGINLSVQQALAEFIHNGYYSQHIRKTRLQYSIKQKLLVDAINKHLSNEVTVAKNNAGLQIMIIFKIDISDIEIAKEAQKEQLTVRPLSLLYQSQKVKQGLILGFAATESDDIKPAVIKLAGIIKNFTTK